MLNKSLLLAALAGTSAHAFAEVIDSSETLDYFELSVEQLLNVSITSSTGSDKPLSQAPSIATVLTHEQLERSSARTLNEALQMVPGLQVYLSPRNLQDPSVDIRGIRSDFNARIVTLVNGQSIDLPNTGGSLRHLDIPISMIQRIEVIRGPGSAIYGADAFSGVINVITKDADFLAKQGGAGIRYGKFDTGELYVNYGRQLSEDLKAGLNLSYAESNGDEGRIVEHDLQSVFDAGFGTQASITPAPMETGYKTLNLNFDVEYKGLSFNFWGNQLKDIGNGAGAANAIDVVGHQESELMVADLSYLAEFSQDLRWKNKIAYVYADRESYFNLLPSGTTLPIGDDGNLGTPGGGFVTFTDGLIGNPFSEESNLTLESTLFYNALDNHDIRVSVGYNYIDFKASETKNFGPGVIDGTEGTVDGTLTDVTGTDYIYSPDVSREILHISLQDEYSFHEDWMLTAGARYDYYSDFGGTFNPRVGMVWHQSSAFTMKFLYGRAFRAPSISELYYQNNPLSLGNEDLKPETIDMLELGTRYTLGQNLITALNLYTYTAKNLIKGVPEAKGVVSQNVGEQKGRGVEAEVSYQVTPSFLLMADYAYRWTRDEETDKAVANVPKHIAHIMGDYNFTDNWFINAELFGVADTPRAELDPRDDIDDYAVVHVSGGYRMQAGINTAIGVRNLFDKEYVDPSDSSPSGDYPMMGRYLFVEWSYRYK